MIERSSPSTTLTPRCAFYGRVSTTDQQSPEESRRWQLGRASGLIEAQGGRIVAHYFDEGQSRSIPWKRRPEAIRLLADVKDPGRGWEAIVIAEPARAFAGNEFAMVFPVLTHYQVDLYVPEVGGRVDPGSEAHELVMALFGGMSKGERNRIKLRVRTAMAEQAREGRYLGGRPAFGYRLADAGPHPNPAAAREGRRIHRLEPDPVFAPITRRIFAEFNAGHGLYLIAERLTNEGVPSPSAADPARNRQHDTNGAWSKTCIRAILQNPRYTGYMTWRRQSNKETLVDVEDVSLGYETKPEWTDPSTWVRSSERSHEPIIDLDTWEASQARWAAGKHRPLEQTRPRRAIHPYQLRRLVRCGLCLRKMEASWVDGHAYYRCRYPEHYAQRKGLEHPRNVHLREAAVIAKLDAILAEKLSEKGLMKLCAEIMNSDGPDDATLARQEAARRAIEECEVKLERYRQGLAAGVSAQLISQWSKEEEGKKLRAQAALDGLEVPPTYSKEDVRALIAMIGDLDEVFRSADPVEKHALYDALGVELTYDPTGKIIRGRARPTGKIVERAGNPEDWGFESGARGI